MDYRIISGDDHIDMQWLPRDLWQARVPAAWRQHAPRVVDTPEGPYWTCGEARWDAWGGRKGAAGDPHADSTWPESRKAIEDNFKDVPATSRRRILCDNARALYGL
jgi:hypothetical protein